MSYAAINNGDSGASIRAKLNVALANCFVNEPVTPTPGGPNDGSVQLSYGTTFILQGASNGDGLQLPPAAAGSFVQLVRQANPAICPAIFAKNGSGDTFNGITDQIDWFVPADTTAAPPLIFVCADDGAWFTNGVLD